MARHALTIATMIGILSVAGIAHAQSSAIGYDREGNFYISGSEPAGPGNYILEPSASPPPARFRQVMAPVHRTSEPPPFVDDESNHYDTSGSRLYGTGHALLPNSQDR